ncbi:hypothetical protein C2845_PM01G43450 [Panicum miliaceum]|uniref:F-box domain-containing protein n=1 Tax=Panicum miliaceum TaxID=4540 RepID=A0A3L6TUF3_PANMI|nr:hypothetical protein C2845_PM01G43450 [Panicum miliaceum]
MAAMHPRLSLIADLPTDVAIQIEGHLAATSEWPMDDLRALRATCRRMHLVCRNPEVAWRINVAGLTDMAWHTPDAYQTFVARLAQLGNLEASFIHGVNVVFCGPMITHLAVLDENIERTAADGYEVAAYVAAVLLYMANYGAGVDATARQYMGQAAMVVDNTWPRPAGADAAHCCFSARRLPLPLESGQSDRPPLPPAWKDVACCRVLIWKKANALACWGGDWLANDDVPNLQEGKDA